MTDTWSILQRRSIATYRPIYRPTAYRNIGRLATDYRPRPRVVHMIRIITDLSFIVWKEYFTLRRQYAHLREVISCVGHDIAANYVILKIIHENILSIKVADLP